MSSPRHNGRAITTRSAEAERTPYSGATRECVRCSAPTTYAKPYCTACIRWAPYVQKVLRGQAGQ